MRLKNKTCVVTGAAAGIGFATASAFAVEGAHVIALDRDLNGLQALKAECPTVKTHILDVTDADAVTLFFETSKTIDVLFNCAGMVATGNVLACSRSDWTRTLDLNVSALFYMCRCFPIGVWCLLRPARRKTQPQSMMLGLFPGVGI